MRNLLKNRRPNETLEVVWPNEAKGAALTICVGFDADDMVKEVFAEQPKVGSDAHAILSDALVLMSILLQHGFPVGQIARHLARESVDPDAPAASILGFIAEKAASLEHTRG